MTPVLAEFIGTAVMLLLGTGVCANVSLARTKGNGAGWIVVIVTWAMAVFTGVVIAGPYSGAHLNPSVTLAFAATGQFPWSDVPGYVLAQMLGGAAGALATWLFYRPHFDLEENPDTIRGVFCTAPAVRNPASNLLSEIIATFVLIFTIFYITEGHLASTEGNVPIGLGSVGALPVALVILVIGGALGGTTGYSLAQQQQIHAAAQRDAAVFPAEERLALCVDRLGRTAARGAARRRSSSDDPLLKHESRNLDSGFRVRTGRYSAGIVFVSGGGKRQAG